MMSDFNIILDNLALLKGQRALFRIRNGLLANILDKYEEDVKKNNNFHLGSGNTTTTGSNKSSPNKHHRKYHDEDAEDITHVRNLLNMSSNQVSEQQPLLSNGNACTDNVWGDKRNSGGSEIIEIYSDNIQGHPHTNGLSRREKNGSENHHNHHHYQLTSSSEGVVSIPLPAPEKEEPRFPPEKWKTFLAVVFFTFNVTLNLTCLAIIHDRVPDRSKNPPLPDIFFDLFPPIDWALDVSEIIIMISIWSTLLFIFVHKHRFIILRRVFFLMALFYLMRSVTMFVTQVPVASTTYFCSPRENSTTAALIVKRVLRIMSGFGLSINGQHIYCGDYIYSGHTVTLTMSYLVIREYTPRRWFPLHYLSWTASAAGIVFVLLSRGHYSVDVVIAYYVTTRVFWIYHTMCNNQILKKNGPNNFLARTWWFSIFTYFEKNVGGCVPRQYEWPLPWPRRFLKRSRIS